MGHLEDMNTFVHIVDAGGISRAADSLGVAKSAVSRRLFELEARLDVQLVNRTTRQSSLTEAGRSYYERAQRILADVGELDAAMSSSGTALDGELRVAIPLSFGLQHLAPAINDFAATHPGVVIHLDLSDRMVDLVEDGFDVAVRIGALGDSTHIARKLAPIGMVVCASPAYLDRAGTPARPADLKSHQILQYANTPGHTWRFKGPDGHEKSVSLPTTLSANNGDYLCQAACAGLGIAVLPTFVAWEALNGGQLGRVLPDYEVAAVNAYALYPQTRHLSRRVRAFIDALVAWFGSEPYWDNCLGGNVQDEDRK